MLDLNISGRNVLSKAATDHNLLRQRSGKEPLSAQVDNGRAIAENGHFVPRSINLSSVSTFEQPRLLGGGKLSASSWNSLKNSVNNLKDAYNSKDTEQKINAKIRTLNNEVERYLRNADSEDENILSKLEKDIPANAKDINFESKIDNCLILIETGSRR